MSDLTFHPFDGGKPRKFWSSRLFGAWDELVCWLVGEDVQDKHRYALIEMFQGDDDRCEVVTFDGEPIGVLDRADIGKADLERFETIEQIERREGAEDAARELYAEVNRELRRAG